MLRHFVSQEDLTPEEILGIFHLTKTLKPAVPRDDLRQRTLVMFFEKASTRTRLSFEIGMTQLGGHAIYLDRESSQLSRGESIADTARVVSRYADLMMARVNQHSTVCGLAEHATVPVINGLSDEEHPAQSMTDLFTILEHQGDVRGKTIAYVGDGNNNVTHSLMLGGAMLGAHVRVGCPPALRPDPSYVRRAKDAAGAAGGTVKVLEDPAEAVADADVVYTDVWVSMGREAESGERLALLRPYQVNGSLMSKARASAIFMHCLPAHVGDEVTADVAYGPQSVIFDQAENRLHVQKALMLQLVEWSKGEHDER